MGVGAVCICICMMGNSGRVGIKIAFAYEFACVCGVVGVGATMEIDDKVRLRLNVRAGRWVRSVKERKRFRERVLATTIADGFATLLSSIHSATSGKSEVDQWKVLRVGGVQRGKVRPMLR